MKPAVPKPRPRPECEPGAASGEAATRHWRPTPLILLSLLLPVPLVVAAAVGVLSWWWVVAVLVINHLVLVALGLWPRSRALGLNYLRLPSAAMARGEIAITFDDGPDSEVTPKVLECLKRFDAHASFFCPATQAQANTDWMKQIVADGHEVENHSWRHAWSFAFYGWRRLGREIRTSQAIITSLTGRRPRFFRAPAGLRNPLLDPLLTRNGLQLVSWTRRGFDTAHNDPGRVFQALTRNLAAGDILLLHDGHAARTSSGQPVVLEVLPRLLEACSQKGLHCVSLSAAFGDGHSGSSR